MAHWDRFLLLFASLFIIIPGIGWINGIPPLGDDSSSHITAIARLAQSLETGAGWWAPDYNLGFPIGLYYQPLPHFVEGTLTFLLGGGIAAIWVYKIVTILGLGLYPWSVALGARFIGMNRTIAAFAGVAAPLIIAPLTTDPDWFGLTVRSSLILALHTQVWGALLLPIALGLVNRVIDGHYRHLAPAIIVWTLLCLSHFFYGLAVISVAIIWLFCRPTELHRRAGRFLLLGSCVGFCLLFWLIPLASGLQSMGGWPFGDEIRVDGYGFEVFFDALLKGNLLDSVPNIVAGPFAEGEFWGWVASVPTLTILVFIGASTALFSFLRKTSYRLLAVALLISAAFTIGRAGFGGWVDIFVVNRGVQMFRYLGIFHLMAAWAIGLGVYGLLNLVPRKDVWAFIVPLVIACLFIPPLIRGGQELATGYRTISDIGMSFHEYGEMADATQQEARANGAGRIFVHPRSGLRGHFHSGLLPFWSANDGGESYGVGLHDSLNFYFLEFFHPERDSTADLFELYGFQYIAADAEIDFSHLGARAHYASVNYTLWRHEERVPLCRPIDVSDEYEGDPRALREDARAWLNGNGPREGRHPLISVPPSFGIRFDSEGIHFDVQLSSATSAPVRVGRQTTVDGPPGSAGELLLDQRSSDRVLCRARMDRPGAVLFRVSYHPFWRALVDGEEAEVFYTFPAFVAIPLDEGEHEVEIQYRQPSYVHPLLFAAPLPPLAAWWFFGTHKKQRRRKQENREAQSDSPVAAPRVSKQRRAKGSKGKGRKRTRRG